MKKSKDDMMTVKSHKWTPMVPLKRAQEHSSVSEENFLEKRPNGEYATVVCSSSYVTTNSRPNIFSTAGQKLDLILSQLSILDLKLSRAVGSSEPEHPAESKNPYKIDSAEE